jgi:hypothetical protein
MSDATDCVNALQALGPVPAALAQHLLASKGYAFQALVFKKLGDSLSPPGWQWRDPTGHPTYATGAGGSYGKATTERSFCEAGDRVFVQEITIQGLSGARHQLDLSLVRRLIHPEPEYPPWQLVGTSVECKNRGTTANPQSISMGEARDLIGLALDLNCLGIPRRRHLILIAAHSITENAAQFVEAYGQATIEDAAPWEPNTWVQWVRRRLRF